jgi:hypothetical protein
MVKRNVDLEATLDADGIPAAQEVVVEASSSARTSADSARSSGMSMGC